MMEKRAAFLFGLPVLALLCVGADVNSSIKVPAGEERDGDLSTVNGGITVEENAKVRGSCRSVNGGITLGDGAEAGSLSAVNGGIRIGEGGVVHGEASSVNGPVSLDRRSSANEVSSVNGAITLAGAEVTSDLRTVNGGITLREGAIVGGDIVIEAIHGKPDRDAEPLTIEIEGGSILKGNLIVEEKARKVKVYLRDGGRIQGRVENAEVIQD